MNAEWIPYSRPEYTEEDRAIVAMAMAPLEHGRQPGDMARELEAELAAQLDVPASYVLATNSATAAMHIAYTYLWGARQAPTGVPIMTWPSSYVTTIDKALLDVNPDTGRLDTEDLLKGLTPHTGFNSLCFVELWGVPSSLAEVGDLKAIEVPVLIDAAHNVLDPRHGAWVKAKPDWFVAYSFNSIKEISADRGGALIGQAVHQQRQRAEAVRDSGTVGRDFLVACGGNFEMGELNAALARNQLRHFRGRRNQRRTRLGWYRQRLERSYGGEDLPVKVFGDSGHLCVLRFDTREQRNAVQSELLANRICTTVHYPLPLWRAPIEFPHAHALSQRILTVPLHLGLCEADVDNICSIVKRTV